MATERTTLFIRCSREEAEQIREMAKNERRTVSGYVLHAVLSRIEHPTQFQETWKRTSLPALGRSSE